ncbi:unnamed protein product [Linum trigynum]|uniref:Uncharacterized protein n=1 Tax=Linum trigynum TaxID=586398 RepID=A0AAV2D8K3_9ROSI
MQGRSGSGLSGICTMLLHCSSICLYHRSSLWPVATEGGFKMTGNIGFGARQMSPKIERRPYRRRKLGGRSNVRWRGGAKGARSSGAARKVKVQFFNCGQFGAFYGVIIEFLGQGMATLQIKDDTGRGSRQQLVTC